MGSFDSVVAECPVCGFHLRFQTKAGECVMKDYQLDAVPACIAEDLDGQREECPSCHTHVFIRHYSPPPTVVMRVDISGSVYSTEGEGEEGDW